MGASSKKYIKAAMRWAWLAVVAAVIAGSLAYFMSARQPHTYEANARLIVGPGVTALNPGLNDMRAAAQLMWIYAEYATSDQILQQVIDKNNLSLTVDELRSKVSASPDQTTLWLTIRVRSKDKTLPDVVANGVADALVNMSPTGANLPANQNKAYIGGQIEKVQAELSAAEDRLATAQAGLDGTKDPIVQRFYQDQVTQQRVYATDLRGVLTNLYNMYQSSYTNQVSLVEAAAAPTVVDTNVMLGALLAAMAAIIATLGIVFAFVYFDDAIHTPEELKDAIDLPLLGVINKHKRAGGKNKPYPAASKRSETYVLGKQGY